MATKAQVDAAPSDQWTTLCERVGELTSATWVKTASGRIVWAQVAHLAPLRLEYLSDVIPNLRPPPPLL